MPSTLYSIYSSQRALSLNQAAIDIINSNISNINTKGYSKQRLEISSLVNNSPYQNTLDASQDGMGAVIDGITRNRDVFVDASFRKETTDLNYYKEYSENAVNLENIVNEMGDTGLNEALNDFYNALSQLSNNPGDYTTRSSLVQSAITLSTKFNSVYTSLTNTRTGLVGDASNPSTLDQSKLSISIEDLNNKLSSIADLNDKINLATVQGITPNSLMDARDRLIDSVSEYIPVNLTYENNNTVTISLGTMELVRGNDQKGVFSINVGDADNPSVVQIGDEDGNAYLTDAYSLFTSGKIAAILQAGGSDTDKLTVKGMIDSLNTLAEEFADAINTLQTGGRYIDNSSAPPYELSNNTSNPIDALLPLDADPEEFFIDSDASGTITAGNIQVNSTIVNNPYQIAAASATSGFDEIGDGSNALAMSQIRNDNRAGLGGATTQGYITDFIGRLGTQSKAVQDNYEIKESITQQISKKRDSITGVSLDEELADLVRFQRSYEASAKVLTVINQTISTIINMMG